MCTGKQKLFEHQSLVSNYINPDTPYTGLLMFQGTGTGKTRSAIAVAEKFTDQVKKYKTKINLR